MQVGSMSALFRAGATVESAGCTGMEPATLGRGCITGIGHATPVVSTRGPGARRAFTDNDPRRRRRDSDICLAGWNLKVEEKPGWLGSGAGGWVP